MQDARPFFAILASLVSLCGPASALVGDASPADIVVQRHTILVYSAKGQCSGVVLAQDLVLTAAHCIKSEDDTYFVGGVVASVQFVRGRIAAIVRHPEFRKTKSSNPDLAVIKLAEPLPARFTPAFLQVRPLRRGDRVIVGGYGKSSAEDTAAKASLRSAALVVSRLRLGSADLADSSREEGIRPGPCHGDSGGPVFTYRGLFALVGIMTGGDCRGMARIVAVSHYYDWIVETAEKLGSPLK